VAEPGPGALRLVLDAETSAVPLARHWASEVGTHRGLPADALGVLQLLVTEAVANAVEHGRGPITVEITRPDGPGDPGTLRVRVHDTAARHPVLRHVGAMATGGRGVALIDQLAAGWGVHREPGPGKAVWFDVGPGTTWPED
jgi:anti-sigma regulatory factor (Ser/Thr protein kinase)